MSAAEPSTTITTDISLKSHAGDWESHTLNSREYNSFIDKTKRFLDGVQDVGMSFITTEMDGWICGGGDGGVPISHISSQKKRKGEDTRADIVACELLSPGRIKVKINKECEFHKNLSDLMDEAVAECQSIPGERRGAQRHYTLLNEQVPEFVNQVVAYFAAKNISLIQGKELPSPDGEYLQLSLPHTNGANCRDDKWRISRLTKGSGRVQQEEIASIRSLGGHTQLNLNFSYKDFKDIVLLMQEVKQSTPPIRSFSTDQAAREEGLAMRNAQDLLLQRHRELRIDPKPNSHFGYEMDVLRRFRQYQSLPDSAQRKKALDVDNLLYSSQGGGVAPETTRETSQESFPRKKEWTKKALEKLLPVRLSR